MSAINIIHSCNNTLIVSRNSQKIGTQSLLYDVAMIMQRYSCVSSDVNTCPGDPGFLVVGFPFSVLLHTSWEVTAY
jgi:hypothetical protein